MRRACDKEERCFTTELMGWHICSGNRSYTVLMRDINTTVKIRRSPLLLLVQKNTSILTRMHYSKFCFKHCFVQKCVSKGIKPQQSETMGPFT